ncbi:MAG TPA: hypothetical protein VJB57_02345 [Dehalococcoidia bacterium]|nr:hypothetical protein [Dehalococcoidia bacterium]
MTQDLRDLVEQARTSLERLASHGMLRVALAAFLVGVFLHVCVVYAILDDGAGRNTSASPRSPGAAPVTAAPTATRPVDRTNCDAIRGTDYRSDTERQWFLTNCRAALP